MLVKGRPNNMEMVSVFVKLHGDSPDALRGIKRLVQLTLKINNTNPTSSYYHDFSPGKRLHPVWYSERHTKWGEESLTTTQTVQALLNQDQASLTVMMTILYSTTDKLPVCNSPFAKYFNSRDFSDVLFRIHGIDDSHDNEPAIVYGHRNILAALSPWFQTLFTSGMRETFENEVNIFGVKRKLFMRVLRYCYTLHISIRGVADAYELLAAADRYQMVSLRDEVLRFLRHEITLHNVLEIWWWADTLDCEKTSDACRQFVSSHFVELIKQPSWINADARVLKLALQIDKGCLPTEQALYEAVVLWAKHPLSRIESESIQDLKKQQKEPQNDCGLALEADSAVSQCEQNLRNLSIRPAANQIGTVNQDDQLTVSKAIDRKAKNDELLADMSDEEMENIMNACEDLYQRQQMLIDLLPHIRFPIMSPDYLAEIVEQDSFVVDLAGTRDLLYEAYRFHAVKSDKFIPVSIRCQPRDIIAEK
ncbi:uncharacterized protein BYT42DRAFT_368127 [Radiomyces spectabilis]|uniref:uncharacterized protein n=1 Tax=Radiomyces spectabilis TaxID=64574 RepID=UPI002220F679|nr:uncharacterized protein BYT42DRAFT_368127 [Radiomyces spectabilis]KAI8375925.1 hypothetical protein BYT42DRAFT_368127 [Radiomyces spectabilis]